MPKQTRRIAVFAVSRLPVSRWATRGYAPSAALDVVPDLPSGTRTTPPGDVETWYLGPAEVLLHSGETAHHRDNLGSARPSVWVALRPAVHPAPPELVGATVDPYEGEAWATDESLLVGVVDMPPALAADLAAFFAAHHVERPFEKRQRKRVDPEALGRRGPAGGGPR
jgi:hypothetical protein